MLAQNGLAVLRMPCVRRRNPTKGLALASLTILAEEISSRRPASGSKADDLADSIWLAPEPASTACRFGRRTNISARKELEMTPSPYAPPKASLETGAGDVAPALWNPDAAGVWSVFLTPVFGSTLLLRNWQAIGDESRARTGRIWLIASVIMLVVSGFVPLLGFVYLVTWYFLWQRKQTKYVRERWGTDYPRKKWGKAVAIGVGALVGLWILPLALGALTAVVLALLQALTGG